MSEKIEVGNVVEGKITSIKPFGAIVLLSNNSQGLVHISHISTSYVQNIEDYVSVGDIVKVKVLSYDIDTNKISLSIKDTMPKPEPKQYQKKYTKTSYNDSSKSKPSTNPDDIFEDKFKDWLKVSNERHAGLNKRNKRK